MEISLPSSLREAIDLLARTPDTTVVAGGTDLMVAMNFGRIRPERLMSLRRVAEMRTIEVGSDTYVGAGATFTQMLGTIEDPAMVLAAKTVGSPPIRNAGTLGGNLATCSPAGDALPPLAALDASVVIASAAGERQVKVSAFMLGPKQPDLRPGELIVGVRWRRAGLAQAFLKAGTRNAMVIAVASLALVLDKERRRVGVALGSVGPTVIRAMAAELFAQSWLEDRDWRPGTPTQAALDRFASLAAESARPIDDVRGSALYRRHVVALMARRALERTCASL